MTTAVQNEQEQKVIDGVRKQLYIGGEWRDGAEGSTLPVEDPSSGETLCDVADATVDDARAALAAAHEKQAEWQGTPPRERGGIPRAAWEGGTERKDDLARGVELASGQKGGAV